MLSAAIPARKTIGRKMETYKAVKELAVFMTGDNGHRQLSR
jgi:hypothetical protein